MPGDPPPEPDKDDPDGEFVEIDPTRRYGRYRTILGKGAFKTVYEAFDELEGIDVAWNQVKVADVLRNCDDLERLYSEVHLLKTLKHKNIIKFYTSWVDIKNDNINFITEVFTSGTLRQFRNKHKHVELRALKNWSRQILSGLHYLHSHDPPVIHRDLKCDNLFVNGNQGEVKIGDLGLATILRHAHSAHSVIGTPEFMAPELYEEEYNELVDIYAFGMCLLELVTFEYPYSECTNAAQIYKKVTAGIKPASLSKVEDPSVKQFIEKCISDASERLPARELLRDPFLRLDAENMSIGRTLWPAMNHSGNVITHSNASSSNLYNKEFHGNGRDFTVEGQRKDINTIFLKLRIVDSTGQVRNIHFPFDIEADTSISVATEMVAELDLTDQDVTDIAETIDTEIQAHVPEWMTADAVDDDHDKEVTDQDINNPKAEDELSALRNEPNSPGGLVLERLSSGRRYWCDSPRETSSGSPSRLVSEGDLHASDDLSGENFENVENPIKYDDHLDHHSHDTSPVHQESETQQFIDHGNVGLETIPSSTARRSPSPSPKHVDNHNQREGHSFESVNNQRVVSADQYSNGEQCLHKTPMENESEDAKSGDPKLEPVCVQPKDSGSHPAEDQSSPFVGKYNAAIQSVTETLEHLLVEQKKEPSLKLVENEPEDIRYVIEKLTNLLIEQKKERVELKKQQDMAISSILEEVPPELREKTLIMCRLKVSDYKVHGKLQEHGGYSEESPSHLANSTIYNKSKAPEP